MENQMSLSKYSLYMGISIGLILIVISAFGYIPSMSSMVSLLCFVALIFSTIFAVKSFRDKYCDGKIGPGTIFKFSLLVFIYIGIIAAIYKYITIGYFPSDAEITSIETISEVYSENGVDISSEQLWAILPAASAAVMFIAHLILGLILGGIYAATMKTEDNF